MESIQGDSYVVICIRNNIVTHTFDFPLSSIAIINCNVQLPQWPIKLE